MNDLKIGDKIMDNDPRQSGRVLTIVRFDDFGYVRAEQPYTTRASLRIARERIYTDGKPRRSGFSLVQP